ncbi:MAG: ATP-binding protein [Tenericutes bacterium]|nr:ATP-binding protein [Mycoplasmatota bacterium]
MSFGISFSSLSLFYSILLTITYFKKKRANNYETKLYGWLILTNLVGLLLAIACYYFVLNKETYEIANFIISRFYLIYLTTWIMILTMYVIMISIKKENLDTTWERLLKYMIIMWALASFITFILPLNYVNTNNLVYSYGTSTNFTFLIGFLFEIVCFVFMIKNIKSIKNKKYLPIILYMVGGTIVMVIQKLNPGLLLMTSAETFVTFLMYFTIENPDMKLINELELAKNSAEKANRAKTEFLSSMSHEIRTPLNAIVGLSEIINKTDDIKEIHEDSKDVVNASYTLLEIVNSILDISKIEAGKMEIVKVNYNPKDEIEKLAKLLETRIGSKSLKLNVNIDKNLPSAFYGDLNKIKQIISNLLSNAIKYTDSGSVDLNVIAHNKNNICNLEITIKDTGRGIKEEQLSHLFTKFDRLEEDKNTSIEGTGLGLAITKSLVEMLGGTISVDSSYGVGSTFTVLVPEEISTAIINEEETKEITKYNGVKVLIVDDSKLNLKVAEKILGEYGLKSETAISGEECIEKIKNGNTYDIIFMDIMMPNLSGVETFKELKKDENFNISVVALTADAMEGQKEMYLKEGFIGYLSKPIERTELEAFLKKELKGKETKETTLKKEEIKVDEGKEEILEKAGVDLKEVKKLFTNLNELIFEIQTYISESIKVRKELEEYYNNKDTENYEILVHRLKSESRTFGLMKLGDLFEIHQNKAKQNDWDYINKEYKNLMSEYDKAISVLSKL